MKQRSVYGIEKSGGRNRSTWKWCENPPVPYTILGVIRDAVMESPYEPIEPTLFFVKALNGGVSWINIRIKPGVASEHRTFNASRCN